MSRERNVARMFSELLLVKNRYVRKFAQIRNLKVKIVKFVVLREVYFLSCSCHRSVQAEGVACRSWSNSGACYSSALTIIHCMGSWIVDLLFYSNSFMMGERLDSPRGIDFLQARSHVIQSIRRSIKKNDDNISRDHKSLSFFRFGDEDSYPLTVLAIPAICCLLLVVSLASQTSNENISGLLVSLAVIVLVVILNIYLYRLVNSAESNEIKRELQLILGDYERFSEYCAHSSSHGKCCSCSSCSSCFCHCYCNLCLWEWPVQQTDRFLSRAFIIHIIAIAELNTRRWYA